MSLIDGDGRRILRPLDGGPGKPIPIRRSQAKRIIALFRLKGEHFSSTGGTFWLVRQWCDETKTPYEIEYPHTIRLK